MLPFHAAATLVSGAAIEHSTTPRRLVEFILIKHADAATKRA